jgi:hypothetical protein
MIWNSAVMNTGENILLAPHNKLLGISKTKTKKNDQKGHKATIFN